MSVTVGLEWITCWTGLKLALVEYSTWVRHVSTWMDRMGRIQDFGVEAGLTGRGTYVLACVWDGGLVEASSLGLQGGVWM